MYRKLILSAARLANDPYEEFLYEPDMRFGGVGEVSFYDKLSDSYFEWDREKSNSNITKHGFSFFLARTIFQDGFWFVYGFKKVDGQKRNNAIGKPYGDIKAPLLLVVDVKISSNTIRIISARMNDSTQLAVDYEDNKHRRESVRGSLERHPLDPLWLSQAVDTMWKKLGKSNPHKK